MTSQAIWILAEAEELLQNKEYPEALDKLKGIDRSSLRREEAGRHCILLTEACLRVGDYSAVCIDDAIEVFRFSPDTEKFAKAKYLKGWYLSALGKFAEAKETLLEAYANYLRCHKLHEAAEVLSRLSFVAHHTGNIESAVENLKKCMDIFEETGDEPNRVRMAHNLACIYSEAGRLREALSIYSAFPISASKYSEKSALTAFIMSAMPHALKGDVEAAKRTIAKGQPYLDRYIRERAIYFENLGLISILDEDYEAAEKALRSGLEVSVEIAPESALVPQIKRLFGDLYVATNEFDMAERYAKEALAAAEKINEQVEIAACQRVLAQVEQRRGNEGKALEWYKKAIDLFGLLGSCYELAVTRYLAAMSGLYYNGERTAMLYLAREYFESEGVRHYVGKIESQLRKIQLPRRKVNRAGDVCPTIVGVNRKMKKCMELAENVAQSEMTVLLTGATGTGKDLLARYIHYHSGRTGDFVSFNAAAIQDTMVESELFGCTKGAFTGSRDRVGMLEEADNGTFYLNEIADASLEFQAKLLEVLETHRVRRLGENKIRPVAFRLIAASNHDLHQRMRDNLFRQDLYHRLNEVRIDLPPLDQRKDDIPALVGHFLTFAGFDLTDGNAKDIEQLGKILSERRWPGNVRQLKAEVNRLWASSKGQLARMLVLVRERRDATTEHEELLAVLRETGGNQSKAAKLLGVSEGTIRYRLKKLNGHNIG